MVLVDLPKGRLTNSDLELAAEVLAVGVALEQVNTKHTVESATMAILLPLRLD